MNAFDSWLDLDKADRQAAINALGTGGIDDPVSLVRAPEHLGVFASIGPYFGYAVFGRDSIETAEDLLDTHPKLVRDIVLTLCRLQGTAQNDTSEEEPGKIHHEYRAARIGGNPIPAETESKMRDLQQKWGGAGTDEMIYYGSHDSTPLFVRLLERYCSRHGTKLLDEQIVRHTGQSVTVRQCAESALAWLETKLSNNPLGLFAYRRRNPQGLVNQAWKDSATAYLHTDGSVPHTDAPVASIELQGYAYDAFRATVRLKLGSRDDRARWQTAAEHLQQQTLQSMWLEDARYFAQGIDFTDPENPRAIATITSNPAALLDSGLLHDLPDEQIKRYVQPVIRMTLSEELLTSVGIRCRAVQHWSLLDFIDYHGPNTVWPKETYDIAKGLRRAGFRREARDLEQRLMYGLKQAGDFTEFFYVSRNGNVWYDVDEAVKHFGEQSRGHVIPAPEPAQAWTIAAATRIIHERTPAQPTE